VCCTHATIAIMGRAPTPRLIETAALA
jgi:hypothetical protein